MKNEKRRMKNYGIPVCGARKTLRAYADPCVFRPLHKLPSAFLCPRQRRGAIPRSGMIEIRRRRRHLNFSFFILHFSFPQASAPTEAERTHPGQSCHCEASAHTGCGNPFSPRPGENENEETGDADCHVAALLAMTPFEIVQNQRAAGASAPTGKPGRCKQV